VACPKCAGQGGWTWTVADKEDYLRYPYCWGKGYCSPARAPQYLEAVAANTARLPRDGETDC
jgi:hypothetical protein